MVRTGTWCWRESKERKMAIQEICSSGEALPLLSLNHVSFLCRSVKESVRFYEEVLGFVLIKRPSSFNFSGAWLFNYGVGIHLLEQSSTEELPQKSKSINPKDNHISFQCSDVGLVKRRLDEMGMKYVAAEVEDGGIKVDQVFFHDPDGYMIEICNCENLPPLPLSSCPLKPEKKKSDCKKDAYGFMETQMIETLNTYMMTLSF